MGLRIHRWLGVRREFIVLPDEATGPSVSRCQWVSRFPNEIRINIKLLRFGLDQKCVFLVSIYNMRRGHMSDRKECWLDFYYRKKSWIHRHLPSYLNSPIMVVSTLLFHSGDALKAIPCQRFPNPKGGRGEEIAPVDPFFLGPGSIKCLFTYLTASATVSLYRPLYRKQKQGLSSTPENKESVSVTIGAWTFQTVSRH